ncbi:unnamed protein product [Nippostrongylus brasiliensis]|uniref:SERPIN domain-containing protein n=1 Tax=Nippostrongylus brasiliensis TaxID=27835 RepID=A0A158QZX4_NIPBR|nr:unnamed protein product [Nippostrongylus brasiliensis]
MFPICSCRTAAEQQSSSSSGARPKFRSSIAIGVKEAEFGTTNAPLPILPHLEQALVHGPNLIAVVPRKVPIRQMRHPSSKSDPSSVAAADAFVRFVLKSNLINHGAKLINVAERQNVDITSRELSTFTSSCVFAAVRDRCASTTVVVGVIFSSVVVDDDEIASGK